jgi:hypothetical protein
MYKLYKIITIIIVISLFSGCYFYDEQPKKDEVIVKHNINKKQSKIIDLNIQEIKVDEVLKPKKVISKSKKVTTNKIVKKVIKKPKKIVSKKKIVKKQDFKSSTVLDKKHLDDFAFDFIKKGKQDNNTLLIVGGIQGDEPGGFMSASLISTHYKILKGSVWIVPNLNFYSIIKRNRGPFGDMNRKFANLPKSDPEYKIIQRIKKYIADPHVKLILNLHDGSGFYRPMYVDRWHQPLTWGQSSVIDQEILPGVKKYADTYRISEQIVKYINKHLLKKEDMYRTKNTHTRFRKTYEEQEMSKTLTYYAVTHGKAAFGHETSKSLNVAQRVYYKLLAIEKYMDIMGIKYKREFPLTIKGIKKVLNEDISIIFDDTHIKIPLKDIRNIQKYFPVKPNGKISYLPSNPLIKIIKKRNIYTIYYGNRRLTKLEADYAEHLNFNTKVTFIIDGKKQQVKFGDTVKVKKRFLIVHNKKFRVNVIGYKNRSGIETGHNITKNMFIKRYSIGKDANMYRVEFYKNKKFAGMILVNYTK